MSLDTWLIYFLAALGLSLSPGPNGLLALTHGALHGRRKTLYTICGGAFGFVVVIALSMFGIGALLQTSLLWLTVLKWVGGAYLVWLGIQVWRSPPVGIEPLAQAPSRTGGSLFRQVAEYVLAQRADGVAYPIYITDLDLSARFRQVSGISALRAFDLLSYKKRIEVQLTRALSSEHATNVVSMVS